MQMVKNANVPMTDEMRLLERLANGRIIDAYKRKDKPNTGLSWLVSHGLVVRLHGYSDKYKISTNGRKYLAAHVENRDFEEEKGN